MFISDEQLAARLNSPRNLANRFKNRRDPDATSGSEGSNAPDKEAIEETGEIPGSVQTSRGITFREIKRPGNCRPWLSKQDRTGIKIAAANGIKQKEISQSFGVEISTVSDIINDKRRTPDSDRSANEAKVTAALDKVRERAIDRLMSGLDQITDDKLSGLNAKDASLVCANMAKIVQSTIPQEKNNQQINLVVYRPELRNEKSYETIEV